VAAERQFLSGDMKPGRGAGELAWNINTSRYLTQRVIRRDLLAGLPATAYSGPVTTKITVLLSQGQALNPFETFIRL